MRHFSDSRDRGLSVTIESVATHASPGAPGWLRDVPSATVLSGAPGDVTDVCHDSRRVTPGAAFVAIPGMTVDGNSFIPKAIAAGASVIVVQEDLRERWAAHVREDVAFVAVPDARAALAHVSAGFFGHPARTLGTVGVTGTDGKTTTTHLVAHVLRECGIPAGHLSSVEFGCGGASELNASHMTTLEANDVQRQLAKTRDAGDRWAVIEASSIGLDLHRVDECEFDVGVFTNLAPDHLDFHGTMEEYRAAKAKLFRMVAESAGKGFAKAAVLNADDPASETMRLAAGGVPAVSYALGSEADLVATGLSAGADGMRCTVRLLDHSVSARTRLLGDYNVANCLAAVGVAVSQGVVFEDAVAALESFAGVPGRMEWVDEGQPFRVVVDIASTEQSMRNVLRVLRPVTPGRLIVVFGAAGERDRERRHGIARAVAEYADAAVITNEDPRSEEPESILAEIAGALDAAGFADKYQRIADRREAIAAAFADAKPGDVVLLAGKGTEQSIVIGTTHMPWDERVVARELLRGGRRV